MITLTPQEADKFAQYLLQEAESFKSMADQMDKLPGTSAVAKKYRTEALASQIVAQKLQAYEKQTI